MKNLDFFLCGYDDFLKNEGVSKSENIMKIFSVVLCVYFVDLCVTINY